MEEGSLSTILAFDCGHGYAEEEYAIRNRDSLEFCQNSIFASR